MIRVALTSPAFELHEQKTCVSYCSKTMRRLKNDFQKLAAHRLGKMELRPVGHHVDASLQEPLHRREFGLTDSPAFDRVVSAWSVFDLSVTFTGIRNVALMLGAKNIADKDPPFSNQGTRFQRGYDPRFADPFGRTWFSRLAYTFK